MTREKYCNSHTTFLLTTLPSTDGITERVKDTLEGLHHNNHGTYGIGTVIVIDISVVSKKHHPEE